MKTRRALKKTLFVILIFVLCIPVVCFAGDMDSNGELPAAFDSEGFAVYSLPEGTWYQIIMEDSSVFFYGNEYLTTEDGMITFMLEQPEELAELAGKELSDEEFQDLYDMMLEDTVALSQERDLIIEDSLTAGVPSRTICTHIDLDGQLHAFASNIVFIDGKLFSIMYVHPSKDLETLRDELQIIIQSVRYDGETQAGDYDYPEATEEQPLEMELLFTAERDTPTAMWMMDENSRAACTVLMLMDLTMFADQGAGNPPEYELLDNPSYVGSADDLIRVVIPVKGLEKALIMIFDNTQDTATYYYTDWDDAELDKQKEKSTDQFWENSFDALQAYLQSVQDAISE